jgi:hypothetical protein
MSECEICGAQKWAVISNRGALETWKCEQCGHTVTLHVNRPLFPNGLPPELEVSIPVVARWASKPTPQKIAQLKNICPSLKATPGTALLRYAIHNTTFDLGRFTALEFKTYEPELVALGLEVAARAFAPSLSRGALVLGPANEH